MNIVGNVFIWIFLIIKIFDVVFFFFYVVWFFVFKWLSGMIFIFFVLIIIFLDCGVYLYVKKMCCSLYLFFFEMLYINVFCLKGLFGVF